MDITPYVESLRHDLAAAAEAGGPEAKAAAERLALALDPAMRMALMDALSQAAAEITSELPAGSVDVRLRGREPEFVVDVPTMPMTAPAPPAPITLRKFVSGSSIWLSVRGRRSLANAAAPGWMGNSLVTLTASRSTW